MIRWPSGDHRRPAPGHPVGGGRRRHQRRAGGRVALSAGRPDGRGARATDAIDAHPKDDPGRHRHAQRRTATPESITTVLADNRPPPPTMSSDRRPAPGRRPPPGPVRASGAPCFSGCAPARRRLQAPAPPGPVRRRLGPSGAPRAGAWWASRRPGRAWHRSSLRCAGAGAAARRPPTAPRPRPRLRPGPPRPPVRRRSPPGPRRLGQAPLLRPARRRGPTSVRRPVAGHHSGYPAPAPSRRAH